MRKSVIFNSWREFIHENIVLIPLENSANLRALRNSALNLLNLISPGDRILRPNRNFCLSNEALNTKLERLLDRDTAAVVDYLIAENKILKRVIDTLSEKKKKRIIFTDTERISLVKYGLRLGKRMKDVVTIVKPETILDWHRKLKKKKWDYSHRKKKMGRTKTPDETKELIVKMASENNWSPRRISGELKKCGHQACATTVRTILLQSGITPTSDNTHISWKKFISSHMHNIWATDFFTEEVWTTFGLVTFYVLFFIHLQTRRVYIAGCTPNPEANWTAQQARNFSMVLDEIPQECKYLIHDRDGSFIPFDKVIKTEGIKVIKTPPRSPQCNAYAERFVRECRETLNNLIPLGQKAFFGHLKAIEHYHNFERPHQGIDNQVPIDFNYPTEPADLKDIRCRPSIGGLLNHYYLIELFCMLNLCFSNPTSLS